MPYLYSIKTPSTGLASISVSIAVMYILIYLNDFSSMNIHEQKIFDF